MVWYQRPMQKGFEIPVLDHGFVRYIDHMGTDVDVVEAARISYKSLAVEDLWKLIKKHEQ